MKLIDNFPMTSILSVVGFLFGSILGSDRSVFLEYNLSGIASKPVNFLTNYFTDFLNSVIDGALYGLIIGALLGVVGFIIDFSNKESEN